MRNCLINIEYFHKVPNDIDKFNEIISHRKNIAQYYLFINHKLTISSGERIPNWTLFTVRRGALESDVAILQWANTASLAAFCVATPNCSFLMKTCPSPAILPHARNKMATSDVTK